MRVPVVSRRVVITVTGFAILLGLGALLTPSSKGLTPLPEDDLDLSAAR